MYLSILQEIDGPILASEHVDDYLSQFRFLGRFLQHAVEEVFEFNDQRCGALLIPDPNGCESLTQCARIADPMGCEFAYSGVSPKITELAPDKIAKNPNGSDTNHHGDWQISGNDCSQHGKKCRYPLPGSHLDNQHSQQ